MTGKGDRTHTETPYDKTRGNVALAKLGNALGVRLDSALPDHVLLEQLAARVEGLPQKQGRGSSYLGQLLLDCPFEIPSKTWAWFRGDQ